MTAKECQVGSWRIRLYMAGSADEAARIAGGFCRTVGWCVNIQKTVFVYSGGQEDGFVVEAIAYARFPGSRIDAEKRMRELAELLCVGCNQRSYTIDDGIISTWVAHVLPFEMTASERSGG